MKAKNKNTFRNWVGRLHLWLGMVSGLIVFIIAVTGCIYVFQDEIQDLIYNWRKLPAEKRSFVSPSVIFESVIEAFPNTTPKMVIYQDAVRPAQVTIELDSALHNVYLNPYSGKIIHLQNLETDFFIIIEKLHRFLLLPEEIGKHVTGVATLIFLMMLITGLVLWWPKKWKNAGQNFTIRWRARWRRKNYDWHRSTGFYLVIPALIVATTGLSFSYEWMHDALYPIGNIFNGEKEEVAMPVFQFEKVPSSSVAMDMAFHNTQKLKPDSGMLFVWDQGSGLPILTGTYLEALEFDHQSNFYFHPETGELLISQLYDDKSPGLQLQEMNFGLHTGQYFGLFGKIMAFLSSLFVAALPLTGFFIWWGRKNKRKNLPK